MTKLEWDRLCIGDCVRSIHNLDLVLYVMERCEDERVLAQWREKHPLPEASVVYKFEAGTYHSWVGNWADWCFFNPHEFRV